MRTSDGGPRPIMTHHPDGRKGGPDDGPPQRARPRTQGEEALGGGRRKPEGGESPSLGRAEGILAPEPPERGGRGEGPAREGAPSVTPWGHRLPLRSNAVEPRPEARTRWCHRPPRRGRRVVPACLAPCAWWAFDRASLSAVREKHPGRAEDHWLSVPFWMPDLIAARYSSCSAMCRPRLWASGAVRDLSSQKDSRAASMAFLSITSGSASRLNSR